MVEHAGCSVGDGNQLFPGVPHESLLFGGHRVAPSLPEETIGRLCSSWPGKSVACCRSSSGLTDAGTAGCSAGVRQAATSGIAASRVRTAAVSAAVTKRVTLCIGNLHQTADRCRKRWRMLSRKRDARLEAGLKLMLNLLGDFLEIF